MDVERLGSADRAIVWGALREIIAKHRSFPDAEWSLPKECVDHLCEIYRRFEPQEPVIRYAWLFADSPDLPEGEKEDWKEQEKAVAEAQLNAVRAVHARAGLAGLLELIERVESPGILGLTVGKSGLIEREEDELLREHLATGDSSRARFARGFAAGCMCSQGREWGETKLTGVGRQWSAAQRAELLACMPFDGRTWDLAEESGAETKRQYWRLIRPHALDDPSDIERVVRKLLEHDRPYTAVALLATHERRGKTLPRTLIGDSLERTLQTSPKDDPPSSSFSYHVAGLLELLRASDDIDEHRVAMLEWAFLPVLEHHGGPKLLHRELARNPGFFSEVLAVVFRAEGEEPRELPEEDQARARHGFDLLDSWRTVPGSREDGTIDVEALKDWARRARKAAQSSGRGAAGDRIIGRILSYSPAGTDGVWPHEAVRDVIEDLASTELEREFEIGVYNNRGVVTKSLTEGGAQERKLAERYSGFAVAIRDRWPRTAAMLGRIADTYRVEAEREDQEAELEADLER